MKDKLILQQVQIMKSMQITCTTSQATHTFSIPLPKNYEICRKEIAKSAELELNSTWSIEYHDGQQYVSVENQQEYEMMMEHYEEQFEKSGSPLLVNVKIDIKSCSISEIRKQDEGEQSNVDSSEEQPDEQQHEDQNQSSWNPPLIIQSSTYQTPSEPEQTKQLTLSTRQEQSRHQEEDQSDEKQSNENSQQEQPQSNKKQSEEEEEDEDDDEDEEDDDEQEQKESNSIKSSHKEQQIKEETIQQYSQTQQVQQSSIEKLSAQVRSEQPTSLTQQPQIQQTSPHKTQQQKPTNQKQSQSSKKEQSNHRDKDSSRINISQSKQQDIALTTEEVLSQFIKAPIIISNQPEPKIIQNPQIFSSVVEDKRQKADDSHTRFNNTYYYENTFQKAQQAGRKLIERPQSSIICSFCRKPNQYMQFLCGFYDIRTCEECQDTWVIVSKKRGVNSRKDKFNKQRPKKSECVSGRNMGKACSFCGWEQGREVRAFDISICAACDWKWQFVPLPHKESYSYYN